MHRCKTEFGLFYSEFEDCSDILTAIKNCRFGIYHPAGQDHPHLTLVVDETDTSLIGPTLGQYKDGLRIDGQWSVGKDTFTLEQVVVDEDIPAAITRMREELFAPA